MDRRVLFLGQAPARTKNPLGPLTGRSFRRLCGWWGVSLEAYAAHVERRNLTEAYRGDVFDLPAARRQFRRWAHAGYFAGRPLVVLLGRGVASAAEWPHEWYTIGTLATFTGGWLSWRTCPAVAIPHPSGVSHEWNSPAARVQAGEFLRKMIPQVPVETFSSVPLAVAGRHR